MTTNLRTPPTIDAATLRKWADDARVIALRCGTGLGEQLYLSIRVAALAAEQAEAAFDADMEAEFQRLFPPLDGEDVPEVLPVQPQVDHEFGCLCNSCKGGAA